MLIEQAAAVFKNIGLIAADTVHEIINGAVDSNKLPFHIYCLLFNDRVF